MSGLWKLRCVSDGHALAKPVQSTPKLGTNPSGSYENKRIVFSRLLGSEYMAEQFVANERHNIEQRYPNCTIEVKAAGSGCYCVVATVPQSSVAPAQWQGDEEKRLREEKEENELALAKALAEVERLKKKIEPPVFSKSVATRLHGTRVLEI